jgi:Protein of unknown function (DUF2628)
MATYVVMEPASDRRGEAALFIRDALAPFAVIVPVIWLLWHRLWFEAAMALCVSLTLTAAAAWTGSPQLVGIGSILMGIYVALEGGALKAAAARRRGYEDSAVVEAGSIAEAEERYYRSRPSITQEHKKPAPSESVMPRPASSTGAGLFALPGAH